MMTDLPDPTPPPPRTTPPSQRLTPCAGLFGWRKEAVASPAKSKAPGRDYPTG